MQVGIDMGTLSGGQQAKLDIEELLATRLLVQGNSGSGKSHLLRRLLEQSAQWVQQVIIGLMLNVFGRRLGFLRASSSAV